MRDKLFDIYALQIFVITAQEGNMSATAKQLGLSQSAVSHSIRTLEDYIGLPLFNRSSRPLILTPAGTALFRRGSVLLEEALNLRGAVIESGKGKNSFLRFGMIDSVTAICGANLVKELLEKTLMLTVRSGLTPTITASFLHRELDMIISSRYLESENVTNQLLLSEKFVVIAPKDWKGGGNKRLDLVELNRQIPFIRYYQKSHIGEQVERVLRQLKLKSSRRLEVDTADSLTAMVAGGVGWSITTPLCLLQGYRSVDAVNITLLPDVIEKRQIWLQLRESEYESLGREVFQISSKFLKNSIVKELESINLASKDFFNIHNWREDV